LSLLALPLYVFWLDPILSAALQGAPRRSLMALSYPSTVTGRLSLVLWSAGFQTMFLQAAPMSLFGRLTERRSVAVGLCMALRAYVACRQMAEAGLPGGMSFFVASVLVTSAVGCVVFARFGFVPSMLFAAGLDLHVFFVAPVGR